MKLLIDTCKEQIILESGESYSIDELNEFLKIHSLDHYKIYAESLIKGCIRPEVVGEFAEKWKKLMEESRDKFQWMPIVYPSIVPTTPDELKPPFNFGDFPNPNRFYPDKILTGDPYVTPTTITSDDKE